MDIIEKISLDNLTDSDNLIYKKDIQNLFFCTFLYISFIFSIIAYVLSLNNNLQLNKLTYKLQLYHKIIFILNKKLHFVNNDLLDDDQLSTSLLENIHASFYEDLNYDNRSVITATDSETDSETHSETHSETDSETHSETNLSDSGQETDNLNSSEGEILESNLESVDLDNSRLFSYGRNWFF